MLDKIKTIKKIKNKSKRYDVGVENVNNFYANGVLVHNCQNLSSEYEEMKKHTYYVTEKLDGSSATFYVKDGEFGICSRNLELLESETNTFWRVARILDLENKMKSLNKNISFQGELIGEGIQGNPYKVIGQTVKFFNIFDIDNFKYYEFADFIYVMAFLGLSYVPVLSEDFKLPETIDELINFADDKSQLNQNFDREGIVIRSYDKSVSFKVISNKFLLSEK
jgi:RNA ligase (TIGR02306 family)